MAWILITLTVVAGFDASAKPHGDAPWCPQFGLSVTGQQKLRVHVLEYAESLWGAFLWADSVRWWGQVEGGGDLRR